MGSALLVVSLFLPWYEHFEHSVFVITRGANDTETVTLDAAASPPGACSR